MVLVGIGVSGAFAQDRAALEACVRLTNDAERLACFDHAMAPAPPSPSAAAAAPVERVPPAPVPPTRSPLGDRWAIGLTGTDTLFDVRPHKPTYLLPVRYTDRTNERPFSPDQVGGVEDAALDPVEAKFQISFKFKLADMTDSIGASLWIGYTQQSQWQVYNANVSRPFRETNYEPEAMLAWHPDRKLGGWNWRLFNLGLVHQSNGRAEPLSRSWDRIYAQFGFEHGDFMVLLRPWYRLPERQEKDDNPDITRYLGHGDLVLSWRTGKHLLSATGRLNASSGKGSLQATWGYPLLRRVNAYVQLFSGYGESMIDYNHYQNTIGIGVALEDWQ